MITAFYPACERSRGLGSCTVMGTARTHRAHPESQSHLVLDYALSDEGLHHTNCRLAVIEYYPSISVHHSGPKDEIDSRRDGRCGPLRIYYRDMSRAMIIVMREFGIVIIHLMRFVLRFRTV